MSRDRFPVVVHVLLMRGPAARRELFLLRRAGTGFLDGYHVPPGGHLEAGETVTGAALRECAEESGVRPEQLEPLCVLPYRAGRHQGFNFVFGAAGWTGEPRIGEPAHSDRAGWFAVDALPEPRAPWLADALELAGSGAWFRELSYPQR